jgi:hypothetical protein
MMRIALACVVSLFMASVAQAGGTSVNVAATAGRVWVTTGTNVVELDATTGRVLYRIKTRYPYPIEVGLSDGNVWTSSVANGFVSGAVTRSPFDSSATSEALVLPHRPVLGLAVGSSTTWALVGPWRSLRLAAIDHASGHVSLTRIGGEVAAVAADNTGGTRGLYGLTRRGGLVRLGKPGWRSAVGGNVAVPAVADGSVWALTGAFLYRIDPETGRAKARAPIIGLPTQLAVGGGFVWSLSVRRTKTDLRYTLSKYDRNLRLIGRRAVGNSADSVAFGSGGVWIGRNRPSVGVIRVDPQTMRSKVFAAGLR